MNNLSSVEWVQAIGWTLLHAFWQLALIGGIAWLWYRLTTSQNPGKRYAGMVFFLVLCLFVTGYTFIRLWWDFDLSQEGIMAAEPAATVQMPGPDTDGASTPASLSGWLNAHLHWLTIGWLLGVTLLALRAFGGYLFLQYLRVEGAQMPDARWQIRFETLKKGMGINQAVQLLESAVVKGPVTFGYFKPVVLIPAGWLANFPPDQLEVLLLHELAHVYRRDFAVNILLSAITILLFFHPAVHWLSSRIRELREECCDDLALAGGADPVIYAESLIAIFNKKNLALAMNATSHSSHFSQRIRRLLTPPVAEHADRFHLIPVVTSFALLAAVLYAGFLQAQTPAVSVAADKMNVLYIGVDNPLTVAVAGVPSENIRLQSNELTLIDKGNGNFVALARQPGTATISVEANNQPVKQLQFRVKRIPDPMAVYNDLTSGAITAEDFKKRANLSVALTSDYEGMSCQIASFSLIRVRPKEDAIEVFVREGEVNERAKQLIESATPGDFYYFDTIRAKCPSGERPLNALVFRIVEK